MAEWRKYVGSISSGSFVFLFTLTSKFEIRAAKAAFTCTEANFIPAMRSNVTNDRTHVVFQLLSNVSHSYSVVSTNPGISWVLLQTLGSYILVLNSSDPR